MRLVSETNYDITNYQDYVSGIRLLNMAAIIGVSIKIINPKISYIIGRKDYYLL